MSPLFRHVFFHACPGRFFEWFLLDVVFSFAGFTFWLLSCSFLMLVPLLLLLLSAPSSSRRGGGAAAARLQSTVRARCLDALAVPLVVVLVLLGASSSSPLAVLAAIFALLLRLPCLQLWLLSLACSACKLSSFARFPFLDSQVFSWRQKTILAVAGSVFLAFGLCDRFSEGASR